MHLVSGNTHDMSGQRGLVYPTEYLQGYTAGIGLLLCSIVSATLWISIASLGAIGKDVAVCLCFGLLAVATVLLAMRRIKEGLMVLVYMAAIEPAVRLYASSLPYLVMEYAFVFLAVIILLRTKNRTTLSLPVLFYGIYVVFELTGLLQSRSWEFARTVLFPSLGLFACLMISRRIRLDARSFQQILNAFLVGVCGIGALAARIYFSGQIVQWSMMSSNFDASGGMGPNQISFILSVAAFLCIVMAGRVGVEAKIFYVLLAFAFSYLMILTFSRGGGYMLAGAVLVYYVILQRPSLKTAVAVILVTVIAMLAFEMALNKTGEVVTARFNKLDTTNRTALVRHGWRIFLDNPVVGIGTGNFYTVIKEEGYMKVASGSHNELTRAASEHGVLGLLAWALFAGATLRQAAKGYSGIDRALRVTLLIFAFVSMGYNALKLLIQPLLLLIALSAFVDQSSLLQRRIYRVFRG